MEEGKGGGLTSPGWSPAPYKGPIGKGGPTRIGESNGLESAPTGPGRGTAGSGVGSKGRILSLPPFPHV